MESVRVRGFNKLGRGLREQKGERQSAWEADEPGTEAHKLYFCRRYFILRRLCASLGPEGCY